MHQFPFAQRERQMMFIRRILSNPFEILRYIEPECLRLMMRFSYTRVTNMSYFPKRILTWKIFFSSLLIANSEWSKGKIFFRLKMRLSFFSLKLRQLKCYHGNIPTKEIEIDGFAFTFEFFRQSSEGRKKFRHVIFFIRHVLFFPRSGFG